MNIPPMICENIKSDGAGCNRPAVYIVLEWFPCSIDEIWTALFYCGVCAGVLKRARGRAIRMIPLDAVTYAFDPEG